MRCKLFVVTLRRSEGSLASLFFMGRANLAARRWTCEQSSLETEREQRERRMRAVQRCAHDSARESGTLADRIEIREAARAARRRIARHAHGSGTARFDADEQSPLAREARN